MLTNLAVQNAAPKDKDYKLYDSGGLYLFVTTKGARSFRLKYRFEGKEVRLVLGRYPELSLKAARDKRDAARALLREGKDPRLAEKRRRLIGEHAQGSTFEAIARKWYEQQKPKWKPVHASDVITSMERDLFPHIGAFAVADIDEPMLLAVLRKVEARGAVETAHRLRQRAERVFRYAKSLGHPNSNPALEVKEAMAPVPPARKWPALTDVKQLHELVTTLDGSASQPLTRMASRFLSLVAQRPGMVRGACWSEFEKLDENDGKDAIWRIPAARMKLELHLRENEAFDHEVPLARQAVELLKVVRSITGHGKLVFPSHRDLGSPMSENALGFLYKREGYARKHVPHGWRSSFSTVMNEQAERNCLTLDRLVIDRLIIDLMLAHRPKGVSATELRYNRAEYMKRRRELAQEWADLLLEGSLPAAALVEGPRRYRARLSAD